VAGPRLRSPSGKMCSNGPQTAARVGRKLAVALLPPPLLPPAADYDTDATQMSEEKIAAQSPKLAATGAQDSPVSSCTDSPVTRSPKLEPVDAASVLHAIEALALQVNEADHHVQRLEKLTKVSDLAPGLKALQTKARRKSRELQDAIGALQDEHLEAAFKQFDKDNSGTLDWDEMKAAFKVSGLGVSDDVLRTSFKRLDKNGDGLLSMDEFKAIALQSSLAKAPAAC